MSDILNHTAIPYDMAEDAQPGATPDGMFMAQQAALIASQARRIADLEANCRPLVDACYDEMHGTVCDDDPDDEPVASTRDMAGNISHSAITFGMIRRARASLKGETP